MSDLTSRLAQLSPEQRARLAERVAAARAPDPLPDDAIAVTGMACRFPGGSNTPAAFWHLLERGVDAVTTVPPDRWPADAYFDADPDAVGKIVTREGAFIDDVGAFDAAYFGISPVEARQMDPQQRLFLEVALEALESTGLTRAQLAGSACGVFVGVHSQSMDYYQMQLAAAETVDLYTSTGTAHSVVANRLSYVLDLRGPSMAIDTACSSSLVAVHQACLSLRAHESTTAIAGGVNLMLAPDASVAFSRLRVLSPRGRCRTFDASADGMVRGEGCGAIVLRRLSDAVRDGDPVLAVIRGSAVNQDGATNGLTAPNTLSQIAVIRSALAVAKLEPSRVTFVETHGTGTSLGDPIEVDAIAATYGVPRESGDPVVLGALKTNIGHLEGAAGIASIIKTVLCLQHRHIPRNLHFTRQNPLLQLEGTSIELATEAREWTATQHRRIGAVSSFGFGGTNAHVLLEEAPPRRAASDEAIAAPGIGIESLPLALSAQTPAALQALADRWRHALRGELAAMELRALAYTAAVRRSPFAHRVVVMGSDTAAWADRLDAWRRNGDADALPALRPGKRRGVAFAFCGQGPQWFAMGRDLLATEPVFRAAVEQVHLAVQKAAGWDLLAELARDEATTRIHETEFTQPALFAVQMGLVALWRAWGVEPDFVIGHSMGEIAAACTAGAVSIDEGARIAVWRGRAVRQAEGLGEMIALPITAATAARAIAGLEEKVGIAAVNAPSSVVLAGDAESLAAVTRQLQAEGIEGRTLEVRYASHSPQMEPLVGWLRDALGTVSQQTPTVPMYSSIKHARVDGAVFDAAHWGDGLRRSVDFAGGVTAALEVGCRTFVDIAPHPVMASYVRECAEAVGSDVLAVASLRRTVGERTQMLQSLGELWAAGVDVRWDAVLPTRPAVANLPTYPWQHERFWLPVSAARPARESRAVAMSEVLHALQWHATHGPATPRATLSRPVILLGGPAAMQAAVAARIGEAAGACRAFSESAVQEALAAARAVRGDLLDLRATAAAADGEPADATQRAAALQHLLALAASGDGGSGDGARIWGVTRGAQCVEAAEVPSVAQASVWGIGRVAAVELPVVWGGLVDLDASAGPAQDAADLFEALTAAADDRDAAYRAGRRYLPRLRALQVAAPPVTFSAEGYYIVTGGLGGIGLAVGAWLAQRGARRVVLLSRTPMPPRAQWDDATLSAADRRRVAGVRAIEGHGAAVWTVAADVADRSALAAVLSERRLAGWGVVRGAVHCAVAVEAALLASDDRQALEHLIGTKIGGAAALRDALSDDAPDFFVMFSSIASLLGERGHGAYAAANAALDAWTIAARHAGMPAHVINWGAWQDLGLAATAGGALIAETLTHRGVHPLTIADGMEAMGAVLSAGLPAATAFRSGPADAMVSVPDPWRVLDGLPTTGAVVAPTSVPSARDALATLPDPREREARLTDMVREIVAETLELDHARLAVDQPLGTLGMDSLLATRIRRRCERTFALTLPATVLFSYPTVAALSGLLLTRLDLAQQPAESAATPDVGRPTSGATVETLSDDEALAALRARRAPRRSGG